MRFLHVSDLHIGKRVNNRSLAEDQARILAAIVDIARSNQVQAVVIAGDIYDKASPSAEAVAMFDGFLTDLASAGVRVIAVPGNHDSAERIAYAQGMLSHQGVFFPPVYAGEIAAVPLEDEFGPVVFWLIPFLKPGDVRRFFPDVEIGDDFSAALRAVLGACDIDPAIRNVAVSHQFVTAAGQDTDRAEEEIKLGGIDNVDVSVYDAFDYVALGHVHRPQRIGRDTARYAGSPLKYSFGEARYEKSAVLVELGAKQVEGVTGEAGEVGEAGKVGGTGDKADNPREAPPCVSTTLVPLESLHDMRDLRGAFDDLLAAGEAAPSEDYLRIVLTDKHPRLDAMAKLRSVYPNAMELVYEDIASPTRSGAKRTAVDPGKVSMLDLFADFYEEQVGSPMDEAQRSFLEGAVREVLETASRGEAPAPTAKGGAR